MLRVLRDGGVLYLAIPDKRHSFDADRPVTTLDHLWNDYANGPASSKRAHFEEWTRLVVKCNDPEQVEREVNRLLETEYSIHYHVWTPTAMMELMLALKKAWHFEVELMLRNQVEVIFILRKQTREAALATHATWEPATGWSTQL